MQILFGKWDQKPKNISTYILLLSRVYNSN